MRAKFALIGMLLTSALPVTSMAQTCKVTDPTTTPLNVRVTPNGKIIGTVKNGTVVYISEYRYDNEGRPWAMVFNAKNDRYLGWVYREFLSCYLK